MKWFLDENVSSLVVPHLRTLWRDHHEFVYSHEHADRYDHVSDIELFQRVSADGAKVFVTADRNQMKDVKERSALYAADLHWVGFKHNDMTGIPGASFLVASLTAAIPHVIDTIDKAEEPQLIRIKNVERALQQRITSCAVWTQQLPTADGLAP